MNYLLPERLDRLAREYALGTLAGPARRRFERVLQSSHAASAVVDLWRQRLSVLDLSLVPMPPPASNWAAIEQRLFANPETTGGKSSWTRDAIRVRVLSWLSGRSLGIALASALVCLTLVRLEPGVVGMEPLAQTVSPSYIGLVVDPAGKPVLVVSSRRQGRQLTMKLLQPLDVPAGELAQLWAVPAKGDGAPFPIGVLPSKGSGRSELPDTSEKLFAKVSQIAVSYEKSVAKPGERPSGPFVLTGNCVKVW
jgi:anti-sigma-K factor RskA